RFGDDPDAWLRPICAGDGTGDVVRPGLALLCAVGHDRGEYGRQTGAGSSPDRENCRNGQYVLCAHGASSYAMSRRFDNLPANARAVQATSYLTGGPLGSGDIIQHRRHREMTHVRYLTLVLLGVTLSGCATGARQVSDGATVPQTQKPRVVVTTDPELDDSNSLIRYLLYSTDFRTEGLVYASSQFHWKGDGTGKKWFVAGREYTRFGLNLCPCESWRWAQTERFIDDAVDIYERVYPNLRVHHADYPTPAELRSKIRWGNVEFDGDISKDTPGSDLIRDLLLDDDPEPIYLLAWGGASTIARALKSIQERY